MTVFYNNLDLDPAGGWGPDSGTATNPSAILDLFVLGGWGVPPFQAGDTVRCTGGARAQTYPIDERHPLAQNYYDGWDGGPDGLGYAHWSLHNATNDPWDFSIAANRLQNGDVLRRMAIKQDSLSFGGLANATTLRFRTCLFQWDGTLATTAGAGSNCTILFAGCTFDCRVLSMGYGGGIGNDWLYRDCFFNRCYPTLGNPGDNAAVYEFTRCSFTETEKKIRAMLPPAAVLTDCLFEQVLGITIPDVADITPENMNFLNTSLSAVTDDQIRSNWTSYGIAEGFSGAARLGPGAWYFDSRVPVITAAPQDGPAPLSVNFTGGPDSGVVGYRWDFGDGFASDDQNPSHTYDSPGTYTVTYTITDRLGNTSSTTITVYVYNADYSIGYTVAHTDFCARFAMPREPAQGEGWAFYNGDAWPLAIGRIGTLEIINAADERIPMVMDCNSFEIHELGNPDQWKDGEDEYGASEIESEILLPEVTPPVGAAAVLRHSQTHVYVKPWFKDLLNTGDFDGEGYRPNFAMNVFARIDSSPNDFVETVRVPKEGQVVFDRHFQSPFVQFGIRPKVAPWRIPKIQSWLVEEDIAAGPDDKLMSEDTWSGEWSEPLLWIGRDRINPFLNRATGETASGSYASLVTGPDKYSQSAMALGSNSISTDIAALTSDFTMCWWLKGITGPVTLYSDGTLTVRISSASGRLRLRFEDGSNNIAIWLDQTYVDWTMISVVRSGEKLLVYENGALTNTVHMADAYIEYGGTAVLCSGGCSVWDVRGVARAVSHEAHEYFYNDVVDHAGNSTCWIW